MKVYTQKEFDAIKRDEYGVKPCPTGDYTQIKSFPEQCSFGGGAALVRGAALARSAALRQLESLTAHTLPVTGSEARKEKRTFSRAITGALSAQVASLAPLMSLP